jgi:Flp pilus assembly protein CpaB
LTAAAPARRRAGAIHASTVFAVVIATVAALICTLVVKTVFFDKPSKGPEAGPALRALTVAAVNMTDKVFINEGMFKTIKVSEEEYRKKVNGSQTGNRVMLEGNQPYGRTTIKAIKAEEPIFEDQLEPLTYPEPVSNRLAPGKRAVVIAVPSNATMIQVGDHVDVLCTLTHDSPLVQQGATTTAVMAKNLKCIARFNSTRTAVQPDPRSPTRTYTLEATPYRAALIELAKSVGGQFNLTVSPRQPSEEGAGAGSVGAVADVGAEDPQTDRVTMEDLAKVFGIKPPEPPPPVWQVERYSGVNRGAPLLFPGYSNAVPEKPAEKQPAGARGEPGVRPPATRLDSSNAAPAQSPPRNPVIPASSGSGGGNRSSAAPASGQGGVRGRTTAVASNYGFRAPGTSANNRGCPGCGK